MLPTDLPALAMPVRAPGGFCEPIRCAFPEAGWTFTRQWHHSGFGVHAGYRIQRDDHDDQEKLAQYILRNPFSLEKMTYIPETGEVIYRSKRNHVTNRLWETFDAPASPTGATKSHQTLTLNAFLRDEDDRSLDNRHTHFLESNQQGII